MDKWAGTKRLEITVEEQNKGGRKKRFEVNLRDLWKNTKCTFEVLGSQKKRKRKGLRKFFEEIIAENFLNMGKEIVNQVQEAQSVPHRIKPRRNKPRHILIKLTNHEERTLK